MQNLSLAICKPDHLGDFVLALPTLRQLHRAGATLTLFVASASLGLARHFCPWAETVALDMPNLRCAKTPLAWSTAYATLGRLRAFDAVLFLRRDAVLQPEAFARWTDAAFFIEDRNDIHQSRLEHALVTNLTGPYDVEATFFTGRSMHFPADPRTVVFAIGAGFLHKKWSPLLWAALGQLLQARDIAIRILSGPHEIAEAQIVARALDLDDPGSIFVGGDDFQALEDWLDDSDAVVAVDGGSGHLCSLRKPVLSLFGPSPMARFAPIGAHNRVVTRALACSPCVGFDTRIVNSCLSHECLYALRPHTVLKALLLPEAVPGTRIRLGGPDQARVLFGPSIALESSGP